jgi:hypothetical protein
MQAALPAACTLRAARRGDLLDLRFRRPTLASCCAARSRHRRRVWSPPLEPSAQHPSPPAASSFRRLGQLLAIISKGFLGHQPRTLPVERRYAAYAETNSCDDTSLTVLAPLMVLAVVRKGRFREASRAHSLARWEWGVGAA